MLYDMGGINGATRICVSSAALAIISGIVAIHMLYIFYTKANVTYTKICTAICVFELGAISAPIAIVAFFVRSPCRGPRGYYPGCGMNSYRDVGLLLSVMAVTLGVAMVYFIMRTGWLVLCYSIYCVDYFAQFSHQVPALLREIPLTGAMILGSYSLMLITQVIAQRFELHRISKLIGRMTF